MNISYVATDLEFESTSDLSLIVEELGDDVSVNLNEWVGNVYRVALGVGHCDTRADEAVAFCCSLLEKLSDSAKVPWDGCTRRVLDIAFESGTEPKCETYEFSKELVRRVSDLGLSIAVTIYRAGFYSDAGQ
jgi:hypothetical protein